MIKKYFRLGLILLLAAAASLQAQYAALHHFQGSPADGQSPYGSLIQKGNVLYGMARNGGPSSGGVIFKISANGLNYQVLHAFAGGTADGALPFGTLTLYNGKLYGMTYAGGPADLGAIFRMNLDGSGFAVLHKFSSAAADGYHPFGSLTVANGKFFGMTYGGGANGYGVLFRIKPDGTGFAVLHSFAASTSDGFRPYGSLIFSGTRLYGMTTYGGANGQGMIFQINPNGAGFKILHSFNSAAGDGSYPWYGRLLARNSALYGMTTYGGTNNHGVMFKINKNGTGYAVLHSFTGGASNGAYPQGSLIFGGGKLFGMTQMGGTYDDGSLFQVNPDGSGFILLLAFNHSALQGYYPLGDLTRIVSSTSGTKLFGMTWYGGLKDLGVVFSYKIN